MGEEIHEAFNLAWKQGGWTIYLDETYFIEKELKLRNDMVKLLTQGRSNHVTVVLAAQRPVDVSRFALSEPSHLLCASLSDSRDIKTMREITGSEDYAEYLESLKRYEFGWLDRTTGTFRTVTRENVTQALGDGK